MTTRDERTGFCWLCDEDTKGFCRYDDGYGYQVKSICRRCYDEEIEENGN